MKTLQQDVVILIPNYKRNILDTCKYYFTHGFSVAVVSQCHSLDEVELMKHYAVVFDFENALGVGDSRIIGYCEIAKERYNDFGFVLMLDDDVLLSVEEIKIMYDFASKHKDSNLYSPDFRYYMKNGLEDVEKSRVLMHAFLIRRDALVKQIFNFTKGLHFSEDQELVYLLGNSGYLINHKYFINHTKDYTQDTVIEDKVKKSLESALILMSKYKNKVKVFLNEKNGLYYVIFDEK